MEMFFFIGWGKERKERESLKSFIEVVRWGVGCDGERGFSEEVEGCVLGRRRGYYFCESKEEG